MAHARRYSNWRVFFLILCLFSCLALCLDFDPSKIHVPTPEDEEKDFADDPNWDGTEWCDGFTSIGYGEYDLPADHMRSSLFSGNMNGYVVAYPSVGGIVIARPDKLQMKHIGLPRTHDTARAGSDEDEMAVKLMQIGGHWWSDWELYARHKDMADNWMFYDDDFPPLIYVAYPSTGGVWFARYTSNRFSEQLASMSYHQQRIVNMTFPNLPEGLNLALSWTLTMDEEALVLEKFGATFYSSVEECPYLPTTVEEGKALYEPFEKLLEKHITIHPDTRRRGQDDMEAVTDRSEDNGNNRNNWRVWRFVRNLF